MLSVLYNALWYPALPFALLASGATAPERRRERMGQAPVAAENRGFRIWIHAASVGEIAAIVPIAEGITRELPDASMVVTTMTEAGHKQARTRLGAAATILLAPLDWRVAVRSFLETVRPRMVIITETELWPNFLIESARTGAKVAIVNGRLSARSLRRYLLVRELFAHALANVDMVLAQTDADAARFMTLGAARERVFVTGNTKFDFAEYSGIIRPVLQNFAVGRQILIAGSTAPGEERMILTAYRNMLEGFPGLALVIAPRHLDRIGEVEGELRHASLPYLRASKLADNTNPPPGYAVMLLDTMGELRMLYQRASVAFVGGSMLPPRGGQNLAEPAAYAVPVAFGPHYENQREVGDALIENGCGRVVHDAAELESTCVEWLSDEDGRRAAGARARHVLEQLSGGSRKTLRYLMALTGRESGNPRTSKCAGAR